MKQGIIFDMDGTLWDSAENVAKSWNLAIEQSGLLKKTLTTADIKGVMGKTMDKIAEELFGELADGPREKLLARCCAEENDYLRRHGGVLYAGVKETLAALKENQNLYIVSNCQSGYIEAFLDYYGLCNNGKKKGENIRLLAERNHLDAAVYVGDIQGDYDASAEAGVGFIHAAYGFGTVAQKVPAVRAITELAETDIAAAMKKLGDV